MRKTLLLFTLLCAAVLARAQTAVPNGTITGTQCFGIDVSGMGTVGIQVTGSWSGTIQPEVSIAGQAPQNTSVYPTGSSTSQSTIIANNVYQTVSISGANYFQVCGNTVTGTANIYLKPAPQSAGAGRGVGGGSLPSGTQSQALINQNGSTTYATGGGVIYVTAADITAAAGDAAAALNTEITAGCSAGTSPVIHAEGLNGSAQAMITNAFHGVNGAVCHPTIYLNPGTKYITSVPQMLPTGFALHGYIAATSGGTSGAVIGACGQATPGWNGTLCLVNGVNVPQFPDTGNAQTVTIPFNYAHGILPAGTYACVLCIGGQGSAGEGSGFGLDAGGILIDGISVSTGGNNNVIDYYCVQCNERTLIQNSRYADFGTANDVGAMVDRTEAPTGSASNGWSRPVFEELNAAGLTPAACANCVGIYEQGENITVTLLNASGTASNCSTPPIIAVSGISGGAITSEQIINNGTSNCDTGAGGTAPVCVIYGAPATVAEWATFPVAYPGTACTPTSGCPNGGLALQCTVNYTNHAISSLSLGGTANQNFLTSFIAGGLRLRSIDNAYTLSHTGGYGILVDGVNTPSLDAGLHSINIKSGGAAIGIGLYYVVQAGTFENIDADSGYTVHIGNGATGGQVFRSATGFSTFIQDDPDNLSLTATNCPYGVAELVVGIRWSCNGQETIIGALTAGVTTLGATTLGTQNVTGGALTVNGSSAAGGAITINGDGVTPGASVISANTLGTTLNLGSTNATVTTAGALTVASCSGCGGGSGTVSSSTSGYIGQYTGATTIGTPSPLLDNGVTTSNTLTYAGTGGITASGGPLTSGNPAGGVGSSFFLTQQGTVPSSLSASGQDNCYADSTQHGILCNFNAGTTLPLVQGPASSTGSHFAQFNSTNGGLLKDAGALITVAEGGTNASTAANALISLFPTASEVGDLVYCATYSSGCTSWALLSGNTSGTKALIETSAGAPSWSTVATTLDALGNPGATKTFADANYPLVFNSATTTGSQAAFTTGETTAASGSGDVEAQVSTLTTSTAIPFQITQGAAGPAAANAPAVMNISAAAAGGVASSHAGYVGAPLSLLTGNGSAGNGSGNNGGAAGDFTLTTGAGGNTGGGTATGGRGGNFTIVTGAGGTGTTAGAVGNATLQLGGGTAHPFTQTIGSGTITVSGDAPTSGACASEHTASVTDLQTTDVVRVGFNGDPSGVTGIAPVSTGGVFIVAYPKSAGTLGLKVCNDTALTITVGTLVLNWTVQR